MKNAVKQELTAEELQVLEGLLAKLSGEGSYLPWPLFRFITEVTATPNVDLVVVDDKKAILMAWRDDPFGSGWHIPGSIIRHREEIAHRILACAAEEFGCELDVVDRPFAIVQIFDDRGHSVSLCFKAKLRGEPGKRVINEDEAPQAGDLRWFVRPPEQLYPSHFVYRDVLVALSRSELSNEIQVFTQHVGRRDAAQSFPEGSISFNSPLEGNNKV